MGEEAPPESHVTINVLGERTTTCTCKREGEPSVAWCIDALALNVNHKTGKLEKAELPLL
nr:hypothetical protein [Candidatus Njordarchaeum guaymaensis]